VASPTPKAPKSPALAPEGLDRRAGPAGRRVPRERRAPFMVYNASIDREAASTGSTNMTGR
jgi:hypothetical protein